VNKEKIKEEIKKGEKGREAKKMAGGNKWAKNDT
jgi:hypothetical protein